jgi:hypothetical protein
MIRRLRVRIDPEQQTVSFFVFYKTTARAHRKQTVSACAPESPGLCGIPHSRQFFFPHIADFLKPAGEDISCPPDNECVPGAAAGILPRIDSAVIILQQFLPGHAGQTQFNVVTPRRFIRFRQGFFQSSPVNTGPFQIGCAPLSGRFLPETGEIVEPCFGYQIE